MALGLIDHPMGYIEFIRSVVFPVPEKRKRREFLVKANDIERIKAYKRSPYSKGKKIDKTTMEAALAC